MQSHDQRHERMLRTRPQPVRAPVRTGFRRELRSAEDVRKAACARSTGDLLAEVQEEPVCRACLRGAALSRPLAHCLLAGSPLLLHHCRRVFVKTLKDVTFIVDCDASSTVVELKHRVAEQDASWDVQRQRCPPVQSNSFFFYS
jgi:hypothetical protein